MISKNITISMPVDFVEKLDHWVKRVKRTRSEFIREAVRGYIIHLKKKESQYGPQF